MSRRKKKTKSSDTLSNLSVDLPRSSTSSPPATDQKDAQENQPLLVDAPMEKKWKNALIRTIWTLVMISGFIGIIYSGHPSVILLVVVIQTMVYREVISIANVPSRDKQIPFSKRLTW
jgi:phosphatidate cytidylyltransferase